MRLRSVLLLPLGLLGLLAPAAGCEVDELACYPGDFIACGCADGRPGYAQCDAKGQGYGDCGYCGTTPGLAQGVGGAGGEGGAKTAFLAPCETDEECETGLCHPYNAKGKLCSQPCDGPEDCPFPSPGCNMMGVCRAP